MTTSYQGPSGSFHLRRDSGTWRWSEELYSIYGFAPGEVVPTVDLMLSHQHPDDRVAFEQQLLDTLERGRPLSLWHRIVDAHGTTRQVVTAGSAELTDDGAVTAVHGYTTDVSEAVRRTTAEDVQHAMEVISASRPTIEQAKGVLMMRYAIDAEAAFALLRRYSQRENIKVRDVARSVVESMSGRELPTGSRATWDNLAAEMFEGEPRGRVREGSQGS
ncbi:MAG: PAS and ANTAR domain-containing protein [Nocardioidaceae bacterium]